MHSLWVVAAATGACYVYEHMFPYSLIIKRHIVNAWTHAILMRDRFGNGHMLEVWSLIFPSHREPDTNAHMLNAFAHVTLMETRGESGYMLKFYAACFPHADS